jgi:hypothetical protein
VKISIYKQILIAWEAFFIVSEMKRLTLNAQKMMLPCIKNNAFVPSASMLRTELVAAGLFASMHSNSKLIGG